MTEDAGLAGGRTGRPRLTELDREECLRLISPGGVGRIAFTTPTGPMILPVNYLIDQGNVLIRTAFGGPMDENLRTGVPGAEFKVAFEVDRLDETTKEGWSVLIRGGVHHLTAEAERAAAAAAGLESWAGGERELYLTITPIEISGRRIVHA
jgi:nitroimidazol reductase NimA-like FMN-containing flavoprotein (pyridoxamine 5'-phosphate oxidase superfamily)